MMQPLFYAPEVFIEKSAGEVDLPDDPNQWPQQILQELYKQVPYITDYQPHVRMASVDAERGYGLGHVEIQNQTEAPMDTPQDQLDSAGIRTVRIPFIIREKKLSPFDLLINDTGATIPLTENRLRQALFRPQAFDVTSRTPGDQSMIGQLYPPYRQNYGFGGGGIAMNAAGGMGIGKVGMKLAAADEASSAFEAFILSAAEKDANVLTQSAREHIKPKNFAIPKGEGPGGTGKYPIENATHAKAALSMVGAHGSPAEKTRVYSAVAKKYPGIAARSLVPAVKVDAKKEASVLLAILPTLDGFDAEHAANEVNALGPNAFSRIKVASSRFYDALRLVLAAQEQTKHAAWEQWLKPDVVQVQKAVEGYKVKTASRRYWDPQEALMNRGDVVRSFGTKVAMQADLTGCCTLGTNLQKTAEDAPATASVVTKPGMYKVMDSGGKEQLGYVVPQLVDVHGSEIPIALFTNGSTVAVQSDIHGVPAGGANVSLPSGPIGQHGTFYTERDGGVRMTVPFDLQDSVTQGDQPRVYNGTTFGGDKVTLSVQPNLVDVTPVDNGRVLIPAEWKWLPLDGADHISLLSSEEATAANPESKLAHVEVVSDGMSFTLRGTPLTKIATEQRSFLSLDDAIFLLAGLGVEMNYAAEKLAAAVAFSRPEPIKVACLVAPKGDQMKQALEKAAGIVGAIAGFKQPLLLKEAASFPDPQMVDTVLSLGFINPENIMTFVSYLPDIEDVQTKMCELLFAVRCGLSNVPQSALERAVRSTEEVIEGLKILGFQGS